VCTGRFLNCYDPVKVPSTAGGKVRVTRQEYTQEAAAVDEWEIIGVVGLVWLYAWVEIKKS